MITFFAAIEQQSVHKLICIWLLSALMSIKIVYFWVLAGNLFRSMAGLQLIPGAFIMKGDYLWRWWILQSQCSLCIDSSTFCAAQIASNIQKVALYNLRVRNIFRYRSQWCLSPCQSRVNKIPSRCSPNKNFSQFIKNHELVRKRKKRRRKISIFFFAFAELQVFFFAFPKKENFSEWQGKFKLNYNVRHSL